MHRVRRAALAAGAVAAAVLFLRARWTFALELEAHTRGVPAELLLEAVHPGMVEAAAIVRAAAGRVYTMPREHDPLAYQRLVELVYPARPRPDDPAALRSGDLVVLAAGRELELPHEEVFGRGQVRIVRVR